MFFLPKDPFAILILPNEMLRKVYEHLFNTYHVINNYTLSAFYVYYLNLSRSFWGKGNPYPQFIDEKLRLGLQNRWLVNHYD